MFPLNHLIKNTQEQEHEYNSGWILVSKLTLEKSIQVFEEQVTEMLLLKLVWYSLVWLIFENICMITCSLSLFCYFMKKLYDALNLSYFDTYILHIFLIELIFLSTTLQKFIGYRSFVERSDLQIWLWHKYDKSDP